MGEERQACVVLTRNEDGSFSIMDAAGQVREAHGLEDLGRACAEVLEDETLPAVTTPSPTQIQLESMAATAAEVLAERGGAAVKAIAPLFQPALKGIGDGLARAKKKKEANARQRRRDQERRAKRLANKRKLVQLRGAS